MKQQRMKGITFKITNIRAGGTDKLLTTETRPLAAPDMAKIWLNALEADMISKIIPEIFMVVKIDRRMTPNDNRPYNAATNKAATTPVAADSVGVAMPNIISPIMENGITPKGNATRSEFSLSLNVTVETS